MVAFAGPHLNEIGRFGYYDALLFYMVNSLSDETATIRCPLGPNAGALKVAIECVRRHKDLLP
jgi:hypothetical protein